jgi:hypothetical protein
VERRRNTRLWVVAAIVVVLVVALLPALVAYRYTSPEQRDEFVSHPWRGWSFVLAALAVPGDSALKTSGDALRKADWIFSDTGIDPTEVQLLFVTAGRPYDFSQQVAGQNAEAKVTPTYRFIWEVRGTVPSGPEQGADRAAAVVALFDYETGRVLYDVRRDLPAEWFQTPASPSATPSATPAAQ